MTTSDPTHGRIDPDIQRQVDEMEPKSLGSRVAMENTLQHRRDESRAPRLCPSVSPFGSAACCLDDTEEEHEAGHGSAITGAGNLTGIVWPTDATDWQRWAEAREMKQWEPDIIEKSPEQWRVEEGYDRVRRVFEHLAPERRRWSVKFAWYDLWVGAFYDRKTGVWYFCPLPALLITWDRRQPRGR